MNTYLYVLVTGYLWCTCSTAYMNFFFIISHMTDKLSFAIRITYYYLPTHILRCQHKHKERKRETKKYRQIKIEKHRKNEQIIIINTCWKINDIVATFWGRGFCAALWFKTSDRPIQTTMGLCDFFYCQFRDFSLHMFNIFFFHKCLIIAICYCCCINIYLVAF